MKTHRLLSNYKIAHFSKYLTPFKVTTVFFQHTKINKDHIKKIFPTHFKMIPLYKEKSNTENYCNQHEDTRTKITQKTDNLK